MNVNEHAGLSTNISAHLRNIFNRCFLSITQQGILQKQQNMGVEINIPFKNNKDKTQTQTSY